MTIAAVKDCCREKVFYEELQIGDILIPTFHRHFLRSIHLGEDVSHQLFGYAEARYPGEAGLILDFFPLIYQSSK